MRSDASGTRLAGAQPDGVLRVGLLAPPFYGVPPRTYGGIEQHFDGACMARAYLAEYFRATRRPEAVAC